MAQTSLTFLPSDLLHSLCQWIVTQCAARTPAVEMNYQSAPPRSLFRNLLSEDSGTDPATVIRQYTGPAMLYTDRLPRVSIQIQTEGTDDDAVSTKIQAVFECFLDGAGHPIRNVTIPGFAAVDDSAAGHWLIVDAKPRQRPGVISRDARGRSTWTVNLDLGFEKLP